MKINAQTRISAIINHNKEAIEVIAKINPHFKKLKNPILRKVLAPRVNIADAARIGNCEVFDFLSALATIGFEIETDTVYSEPTAQPEATKQENLSISEAVEAGKFKSLDVRPILSQGTDPFKHIMDEIKELPDGVVLEVVNTFEPTPLIKILNNKGYASLVKTDGGVVKTYFMNAVEEIAQKTDGVERIFYVNLDALEAEKAKFKSKYKEVDVRELEMPLPMVTILKELEELPKKHALYVNHKKVPQYLLPELEERKLRTWICEIEDGNVKMLIHH